MFTVYHSNQIDLLKSLLTALIKQQPLTSPFEQEQILVQSPGMSQWLKMEIAEQDGIAANINFPLPATFIWNMFIEVLPDVPARSAFNKEAMTWKLMQILPSLLERESFISLAHYLEQDEDGSKCYQLAEKIADIFDGYLVYRPDYILAWEVLNILKSSVSRGYGRVSCGVSFQAIPSPLANRLITGLISIKTLSTPLPRVSQWIPKGYLSACLCLASAPSLQNIWKP
ncbi:exodeoxyribonuclease V gamma chain [Vibrio ishigakensis]|uniref:Exodeoxyribonuclease V gamma chain n=1 Tax=Vibrio ishigakensis TaxID=1481914 RepID=A0A0B8PQS3_9VIBR|nr:exodeoxyribonuclease V gamma chain [Vibrio ishigakensis]